MRAILIETDKHVIREIEFDGTLTLEAAYSLLDVDMIEGVYLLGHVLYVDEEGLLTPKTLDKGLFRWKTCHQPLAGRGLIVGGTEYGDDWCDATMSLDEATRNVEWLS